MHNMFQIGLIHALPFNERRCYDRKEAASYIGVSSTHLDKLVRRGEVPAPINLLGKKVWNRIALDRAIDARSGIPEALDTEDFLDRELAAFEAKHGRN